MNNQEFDKEIPVFKGTPQEIGRKYAILNKAMLLDCFELWLKDCQKIGISKSKLIDSSAQYIAVTDEIAPWHLEEAKSVAEALELPSKLFIAFIASNRTVDNILYEAGCTSIMAVGSATADGKSIIHKNRDRQDISAQSVYIKEIIYNGKALNRFIGIGYVKDIGPGAFINNKGVSGTVNAGEPYPNPYKGGGLGPGHIMRIIAERASSCEEVLNIIVPILSKPGYYFNSQGNGSIWLFVDKEKGLIIENTARVCAFEYIYNDIAIRANDFILLDRTNAVGNLGRERPGGLVRRERTLRRLQAKKGYITPETIIGAARDWEPAVNVSPWTNEEVEAYLFSNICKTITVSGFMGVIQKNYTNLLSYARIMNGHPNNVYSIPIYLGCESLLLPHINGEFSMISYKLKESNPIGENRSLYIYKEEEEIWKKMSILEKKIIELLDHKREQEARELITKSCNEISQRAIHLMRSAIKKISNS